MRQQVPPGDAQGRGDLKVCGLAGHEPDHAEERGDPCEGPKPPRLSRFREGDHKDLQDDAETE